MRQSPRGERLTGTYFHAVRHAGAFELLGEETFVEHPELIDDRLPIAVLKGVLSQENDLGGAEAEPQDIVKEKVVQIIGAYKPFPSSAGYSRSHPVEAIRD